MPIIAIEGTYFFSESFLSEIDKSKKQKNSSAASILYYILTTISAKNDRKMKFCATESSITKLEEGWGKLENEPASKRLITKYRDSKKFGNVEENVLDIVSDISISESPSYTCFLVSESEYKGIKETNAKLRFQGFEITSAERFLGKYGMFPFDRDFVGKIQDLINSHCS